MIPNAKKSHSVGKFPLVFGSIFLLFSLPFIFAGLNMLKMEERFEADSATITANVTSKRIEELIPQIDWEDICFVPLVLWCR